MTTPVTDPNLLAALEGSSSNKPPVPVNDPSLLGALEYGIDFSQPVETVRASIGNLPADKRESALKAWANHYVNKERIAARETTAGQIGQAATDQLRNVARGALGVGPFLDELNAATQGALHSVTGGYLGSPYDEALAYQRATDRAIDRENPMASGAAKLVGGFASAGPFFKPAETVLGNVAKGAGLGAVFGYEGGFGEGEESFENRHQSGLRGAGLGTALGSALPVATAAGTRAIGAVADAISPTIARLKHGPDAAAETILGQRIASAGKTPAALAEDLRLGNEWARVADSNSKAVLPEMIADTSDSMKRLTGSVYRSGAEAGELVKDALESRQRGPTNRFAPRTEDGPQGQIERVLDSFDRFMGIKSSKSAYRTEQALLAEQKAVGDKLYKQARDSSEAFNLEPALQGMAIKAMQYPDVFGDKLRAAINLFTRPVNNALATRETALLRRIEGIADDASDKATVLRRELLEKWEDLQRSRAIVESKRMPVDNITRFDNAKKALDDMIEGAEGNLKRELTEFKNSLLNRVHVYDDAGVPTRNVAYQKARDEWGTRAEQREAIDLGRAALRENSEITVDQYRDLNAFQRKLFRIGLRESLRTALGPKRPGNDVTQIFQQRRVQDLLDEVIPASRGKDAVFADRAERYGDLLGREERMVQTRNQVLGGSPTQQRSQDDVEFASNALGQLYNKFRLSPTVTNMAVEAIAAGAQKILGFRQDVAKALAVRLTETDPALRAAYLADVAKRMGPDRFKEFAEHVESVASRLAPALTRSMTTPPREKRETGRKIGGRVDGSSQAIENAVRIARRYPI